MDMPFNIPRPCAASLYHDAKNLHVAPLTKAPLRVRPTQRPGSLPQTCPPHTQIPPPQPLHHPHRILPALDRKPDGRDLRLRHISPNPHPPYHTTPCRPPARLEGNPPLTASVAPVSCRRASTLAPPHVFLLNCLPLTDVQQGHMGTALVRCRQLPAVSASVRST
jgi:hypothetical protein